MRLAECVTSSWMHVDCQIKCKYIEFVALHTMSLCLGHNFRADRLRVALHLPPISPSSKFPILILLPLFLHAQPGCCHLASSLSFETTRFALMWLGRSN